MIHEPVLILRPEMVHIEESARIDSWCKMEGGDGLYIGEYVHIASFSHINVGGGEVIFEHHSGCSSGCRVGGASPDWNHLHISAALPEARTYVRRYLTRICAYAVLFMGVVVVPGVTVGEGAVVKPGSVVMGDLEAWTIYQGNPAVPVGIRRVDERYRHLLL